jgi:transposase
VSVDGLGNPLRFQLTPGQRHDITQGEALVVDFEVEPVIGDKGYDSAAFLQFILERGAVPVIPPRSNLKTPRDYDQYLYRERHLVECFINKIKHYRRLFSRPDYIGAVWALPGFLELRRHSHLVEMKMSTRSSTTAAR